MGGVLRRWRREQSSEEVLKSLEEQLQKLEFARQRDEQLYQRFIGRLMFYSIVLYIISALVVYLYYFPKYWRDRIVRTFPLLVFPLIIYGVRRILQYIFSTRKKKNAEKLKELRSKKQKVIEDVKEKETYKKAKEILEKFDPDNSLVNNSVSQKVGNGKAPATTPRPEVRQRHVNRTMSTPNASSSPQPVPLSVPPKVPMVSPIRGMSPALQRHFFINNTPPNSSPGPPRPVSVLPKQRSIADKFVDYLVGDGPSNRYALICKVCHSHNGMALKEDFEFTTFRCCYCYHLNEAKKQRPSAPPLESLSSPGERHSSDPISPNEENEKKESTEVNHLPTEGSAVKNAVESAFKDDEVENVPSPIEDPAPK